MTSSPLVGSSSSTLLRPVHQRTRQRGLELLALREALGQPIRERLHLQQLDELGGARLAIGARQAMQLAEVGDVLARGEIVVDAGAVRQHADGAARRQRIRRHAACRR